HMIHSADKIPFDVAPYRAISFSWAEAEHLKEARAALKGAVAEVIKPDFNVENPITHARGVIEFQQHASPREKVLADEITSLRQRLDVLEVRGLVQEPKLHMLPDGTFGVPVRDSYGGVRMIKPSRSVKLITQPGDDVLGCAGAKLILIG